MVILAGKFFISLPEWKNRRRHIISDEQIVTESVPYPIYTVRWDCDKPNLLLRIAIALRSCTVCGQKKVIHAIEGGVRSPPVC